MLQKLEILFKVIGIVWCCSQFGWKKLALCSIDWCVFSECR